MDREAIRKEAQGIHHRFVLCATGDIECIDEIVALCAKVEREALERAAVEASSRGWVDGFAIAQAIRALIPAEKETGT